MPIRTVASLAVAILLGLVAVFLVRNYITGNRGGAPSAPVGGTTPVVVAASPIERGKVVEGVQLKVAQYPSDAVPAGSFRTVPELTGSSADKRVTMRAIAANEPILADKISGPGGRLVLSASLTEGMRAVSLRSNDVAGVAGFVLPGDRVDILLTRQVNGNTITQVLAENVRVLGVDQTDDDSTNKPQVARAVTVEVTPNQAQSISLAQAVGQVSFALRHVADQLPLSKRATTVADLGFGGGAPAVTRVVTHRAAAPRGPTMNEVRVVRGLDVTGYRIP